MYSLEHILLEMTMRYLSGNMNYAVEYMSIIPRGEEKSGSH